MKGEEGGCKLGERGKGEWYRECREMKQTKNKSWTDNNKHSTNKICQGSKISRMKREVNKCKLGSKKKMWKTSTSLRALYRVSKRVCKVRKPCRVGFWVIR